MTARKNVNAKIDPIIFEELTLIAWHQKISRSDIIRRMVEYFRVNGDIVTEEGGIVPYEEALKEAWILMNEMDQSILDIAWDRGKQVKRDDQLPIPKRLKEAEKILRELRQEWGSGE